MGSSEGGSHQASLFSIDTSLDSAERLDVATWPDHDRFPLNRTGHSVRRPVWDDLATTPVPTIVAGYSSIDQIVAFVADWQHRDDGHLRLLLGTEPYVSPTATYRSVGHAFTAEVREHWLRRGISVELSARLLITLDAIADGHVEARFLPGRQPLHAKIFLGDVAATTGSSNFTRSGLDHQVEVNTRFTRTGEARRYADVALVARNLWEAGEDWTAELAALLADLLQVVSWRDALARACADLLEGTWAAEQLARIRDEDAGLWPSQLVGIAEAMWIVDTVGGVLVADATGSGKTRMGAHLVRAVRDRLWSTGRIRRGQNVLVCPPGVRETWAREAAAANFNLDILSHGKLSAPTRGDDEHHERAQVRRAQLLAVDEAHNFLNPTSNRTRALRDNLADHVVLFTATPISRGATDLLDIVALLGPDNFEDATHDILQRLARRSRSSRAEGLDPEDERQIRREIQRFTLRRTKRDLNALVDADPEAYRHPVTDRICRYPEHRATAYDTVETDADSAAANEIRLLTRQLRGIALLPAEIVVPTSLRRLVSDEQWVRFRLRSAAGLAVHNVMAALRSSRAALYEHVLGTAAAAARYDLPSAFKQGDTGDVLGRLRDAGRTFRPEVDELDCDLPDWLDDDEAFEAARHAEVDTYQQIAAALTRISSAREAGKARLLAELARSHDRVLAFDRHLITLAAIEQRLPDDLDVLIATGQAGRRDRLQRVFSPWHEVEQPVIALCSDAMNEGLNLRGASAVMHLDLPTTLRVAEQRVGRVDRMDSRHDHIEAWWPRDGRAFATRANERLARRVEESRALIGANLELPRLHHDDFDDDEVVDPTDIWAEVEEERELPSDHLADALEPVRALVSGPDPLVPAAVYADARQTAGGDAPATSFVACVVAEAPWAFLSVRSAVHGSPRWMLVDGITRQCTTDLRDVAAAVRARLADDPPGCELDEEVSRVLGDLLGVAGAAERGLLPRRVQRALHQLERVTAAWIARAGEQGDDRLQQRWLAVEDLLRSVPDEDAPDLFAVGERWYELVAPRLEEHRRRGRGRRYVLVDDVTADVVRDPPPLDVIERALATVPVAPPFSSRVTACILGVPPGR